MGPRVSEEAIRRAIEATLALRKQGLDLDLIQIDDGIMLLADTDPPLKMLAHRACLFVPRAWSVSLCVCVAD